MKIVCMIASLRLGGAERQLLGLADSLAQSGHEVEVLTYRRDDFYRGGADGFSRPSGADGFSRPAPIRFFQLEKRGSSLSFARKLADHLKRTGCEVMIAFLPGACLKACLSRIYYKDYKLVVSERNFSRWIGPADAFRLGVFTLSADRVVCNNYAQQQLIRRHWRCLSDRTVTIPNFVDTDAFAPAPAAADPSLPSFYAVKTAAVALRRIVVTARVCPRKNALGLIKAAALLRGKGLSFRIDWYGLPVKTGPACESAYVRTCRRLIDRRGLGDCFAFHPAEKNAAELYRAADLFALVSFYEGTSNSLAEALACGKPAVVSLVSDNARYVENGRNGFLCDPSDVRSIAAALEKALALDDPALEAYGGHSRRIACEKLSKADFQARYAQLLQSL